MTSYLEILHQSQRIFILVKDLVSQIVERMSCFVFVIYIWVLWLRANLYDDIKTTYKYSLVLRNVVELSVPGYLLEIDQPFYMIADGNTSVPS